MPDPLHFLGVTKIHNFISMSDMVSTINSLYAPSPLSPNCPVVIYLRQGQTSYLSLNSLSRHGVVTRRP